MTAKELQRLEKQRKLAQTLRLKADAEENGEDLERKKAWEWSIEQNDRWEAKKADQAIRGDTNFHGTLREQVYDRTMMTMRCWCLGWGFSWVLSRSKGVIGSMSPIRRRRCDELIPRCEPRCS